MGALRPTYQTQPYHTQLLRTTYHTPTISYPALETHIPNSTISYPPLENHIPYPYHIIPTAAFHTHTLFLPGPAFQEDYTFISRQTPGLRLLEDLMFTKRLPMVLIIVSPGRRRHSISLWFCPYFCPFALISHNLLPSNFSLALAIIVA